MRLIRRTSRRFTPRKVDYTYPELRGVRTPRTGILERPAKGAILENVTSSQDVRR